MRIKHEPYQRNKEVPIYEMLPGQVGKVTYWSKSDKYLIGSKVIRSAVGFEIYFNDDPERAWVYSEGVLDETKIRVEIKL